MESINKWLNEEDRIYLMEDESILWSKITTKRKGKKLKEFFILTNKRWIQKINYSNDLAYFYLKTVINLRNKISDVPLQYIKYLFTQHIVKTEGEYIGFILNEKIENQEDYGPAYGVDLTSEEYPKFMEILIIIPLSSTTPALRPEVIPGILVTELY